MPAAAQIRAEIEAALAQRIPAALTPSPRIIRPVAPTGIHALDELLLGGLPIGAISEIVGLECSGRTSLTMSFLAQITSAGKVCAWIDVSDAMHPESAAAAGIDLHRLLWVRCGGKTAETAAGIAHPAPVEAQSLQTSRVQFGGNSPHPRSENRGLPAAIGELLGDRAKYRRNRSIGTPGAPNRPLGPAFPSGSAISHKEQVASDRMPARRGAYVLEQREAFTPRCAETQQRTVPARKTFSPLPPQDQPKAGMNPVADRPLSRLEQALKVTDLLLQAGGFSAIVLDMAGIQPEFASRIPLATWFRYRAAAERTHSSFVLLTQHPCAKSSAGMVLRLDRGEPYEAGPTVLAGFRNQTEISRKRFEQEEARVVSIRKPPQRASTTEWRSRTLWAGGR